MTYILALKCHGIVKNGGFRYEDGTKYIGDWNHKGQKHGMGHLALDDGTRYDGAFSNGLCSGLGVMRFPDGAKLVLRYVNILQRGISKLFFRYEGEFVQGWFHGHGVFSRSDGMKFEGEFRGDRIWGLGLITYKDHTNGFPRNEGFFQDCRMLRKKRCPEVVQRAVKVALLARGQCDEVA